MKKEPGMKTESAQVQAARIQVANVHKVAAARVRVTPSTAAP